MDIQPFAINVPQTELDALTARLATVRWPNVVDDNTEEKGLSLAWLRDAVERWASFDWRATEAELNMIPQFTAAVRGRALHFAHARAPQGRRLPVLLVHGWPDSFLRYHDVIDSLTAAGHDVVVPSLPGFLFSEQPSEPLRLADTAERMHELMTGLRYDRYAVSGGDWGAGIADHLATTHPASIAALHLTEVPFTKSFLVDRSATSETERAYLAAADAWYQRAAYFAIQAAEPTALATGLTDSPIALLAWIGAKVHDWSDAEPNLDRLLTEVSLHWFTGDARSALRFYSEAIDPSRWSDDAGWADGAGTAETGTEASNDWDSNAQEVGGALPHIPTGLTLFPKDFLTAPREYAGRFYDIHRYTLAPRGGHFGAAEEPAFFATELNSLLADLA